MGINGHTTVLEPTINSERHVHSTFRGIDNQGFCSGSTIDWVLKLLTLKVFSSHTSNEISNIIYLAVMETHVE